MSRSSNPLNQPIGFALSNWMPRALPLRKPMNGTYCRVEPLNAEVHAADLFEANQRDVDDRMWTYMAYGPFADFAAYKEWVSGASQMDDTLFFAIIDMTSLKAVGVASFLRIDPSNGAIEVGHIAYSPALQRTHAGTEAMYLMMQYVFDDLGYRRYEWKCDNLNAASRSAAARYGFQFEGIFRQAAVYKNRNRDTAWFAITDKDWPALKVAFESWLAPENRKASGEQKTPLRTFMPTITGAS